MKKFLLSVSCVILSIVAQTPNAQAQTLQYWDNKGTGTPTGGIFDTTTANWATNGTLTASTIAFTNGNFPIFAAGSTSAGSIIVTNNTANIGISGLDNDGVTGQGTACTLTLSGTGSFYLEPGIDQIYISSGVSTTFNVPINGPGSIIQNGLGSLYLNGTNTYTGGTTLTGEQIIYYANNGSFGTGAITNNGGNVITGSTFYFSTLQNNSATALTLSNNVVSGGAGYGVNLVGGAVVAGAPGTTWSGNFLLAAGANVIYTGTTAGNEDKISGVISGAGASLIIGDAGTLILAGTNTYTGTTTLGGNGYVTPVQVDVAENYPNGGPFGIPANGTNSAIIFAGGELQYTSANQYDYSGWFSSASANYTIDVSGQNITFASTLSGNAALTNISSIAGGTLSLTAANQYTGITALNSGTLIANSLADGFSSIGSGNVTLSGGALTYNGTNDGGSVTTSRTWNGVAGITTILDVLPGVTLTLNGGVTGSGAFTINKVDTGTLILSGPNNNSYCGVTVNGGTVILSKTGGNALGSTTVVNTNATLQLANNGYAEEIYSGSTTPLTVNNGGVFDLDGQDSTIYSLSIAGTGIGGNGALINSQPGTTSTLTVPMTLTASVTISGAGSITLPGPIGSTDDSANYALTYAGTGELILDGINTYLGPTIVNSGVLDIGATGFIPGNVTVGSNATNEMDNSTALSPAATINLPNPPVAGMLNLNYGATMPIAALTVGGTPVKPGVYTSSSIIGGVSGVISGPGAIIIGGLYWDPGLTASGTGSGGSGSWDSVTYLDWFNETSDTYWTAGGIPANIANFVGTPGTVTVVNGGPTVAGITFTTPGYLVTNIDGSSTIALSGVEPEMTVATGNTTISANLTGGGSAVGLTVLGTGTLTLTGTNTYAGDTTVNGATLSVKAISDTGASGIGNFAGGSGNLNLVNGATFAYTGTSSNYTARNITNNGAITTYINVTNGILDLAGAVRVGSDSASPVMTKIGNGTLYLGGSSNDNASLSMNINAGKVIITKTNYASAHGLGGGASSVGPGAALQLAGPGGNCLYSGCILTISNGGVLDLNGQPDAFSTLTLSGAGPNGATYPGALINSSVTPTAITNGGGGVVLSGPATISGPGSIELYSAVNGSGSLTYAGSGMLTLNGAGNYSGGTAIPVGAIVNLTNSATAAGTGPITNNGTLDVGIVGNNIILANAITGSGTINLYETSGDNLQLGGVMTGFTGTLNCPTSPGGTAKAQILTTAVNLANATAVNVAAGGTLYVAGAGVTVGSPINLYGIGNSETYGALRIEAGALISGPVTLYGNTSMGNGQSGAAKLATISGPISQSGGTYGITFSNEPGMIVLTGTNTYAGGTTINGGIVEIGGSGSLGSGNYAVNITDNGNLIFASSATQTLSAHISGTGSLSEIGPGILSLSGSGNTYTGGTTNTGGTLIVSYVNESAQTSIGTGPLYVGGGTFSYTNTAAATSGRGVTNVVSGVSPTINVPNGSLTLFGPIGASPAASFTIIKTGAGTLTIGSSSSTNGNAFDGVNVQGGTVILNKPGTYNAVGGPVTVNSGGELQLGGSSPAGGSVEFNTGSSTPLTINSGGIFDLHGLSTTIYSISVAGTGSGSGAIINGSAAASCVVTNSGTGIALKANTSIGGIGSLTLQGPISGAFSLSYVGSAELILTNANTYTGGTTVSSGEVDVSTTGSIQGNVTVSTAATLELDNAAALAANATLTVASGSTNKLNYSGTNTIGALNVAGVAQPQGVYGAGASNPGGVFTGTGAVKVVAAATYPRPGITSFKLSGNTLTFSATNGSANGTYYILESTNEMLPIPQWNVIYTNTFNGSGSIAGQQVPVANSHDSREFYLLLQSTNVSAFP